jgi:hypothetical protein
MILDRRGIGQRILPMEFKVIVDVAVPSRMPKRYERFERIRSTGRSDRLMFDPDVFMPNGI